LTVRREDFLANGGFDDFFAPAYYEDTDLCLRLARDRGRVVLEPNAVVYHMEGGTAGTNEHTGAKQTFIRNRGRLAFRWAQTLATLPPIHEAVALRHALTGGDRPLVLWIMPEFLKPDQSGGGARAKKQIEALKAAGVEVVVWSEHVGDWDRYKAYLEDLRVAWFGYQEPVRWPLGNRIMGHLGSLWDLLGLEIWDAVVGLSADIGHRFGDIVRERLPEVPFIVDCTALLYLQHERAVDAGAVVCRELDVEKEWEIGIYGAADALITASETDAVVIRNELPKLDVFSFNVGAYEPSVLSLNGQRHGSLLFLGNFQHPPNLDAIRWWVQRISPEVEEFAGRVIPLRVIGASAELVAEVVDPGPELEIVGWVESLEDEMSRARAFAVPLRYGAGTKDKIAVAMGHGVPPITTSIGAESMPAELLRAIRVENYARDFARSVVRLMTDDGAWERAASLTRESAAAAWTQQRKTSEVFGAWLKGYTATSAEARAQKLKH
jgi:hypothetical protein